VITTQDFERMVESHQHRIFGFALGLSGNASDAEEIAQDAFVRAHRALEAYDVERVRELKVSAWLHQIALNVFRNRVRRKLRETVPLEAISEPRANGLLPEDLHDLRQAVRRLPSRYREAVVLRHVQGFNYKEIAGVLGVPEGTAKSDVHRGLALLKEELA
jgi:RNA polymerase sigma-70 factor (ECF subfamily)